MTREFTTKLLELVEEGILDSTTVLNACLNYMSEDDVRDMCQSEGFTDDEEESEEEEEDAEEEDEDESEEDEDDDQ